MGRGEGENKKGWTSYQRVWQRIPRLEGVRDAQVEKTTAVEFLYFFATAIIERVISELKIKIKMRCRAAKTIMADVNKAWRFPRGRWSEENEGEKRAREKEGKGEAACMHLCNNGEREKSEL